MTIPEEVEDIYPLSPMQLLMLVHALRDPSSPALVNQVTYEIRGALSPDALHEAWRTVVARHPVLRTGFLWDGLDRPMQVVWRGVEPAFRSTDLSRSRRPRQALATLAREDRGQPFVLQRAPLMRCVLARLGNYDHRLVWTVHHLVLDRWSHGTVVEELAAAYRAHQAGRAPELPPAPSFRSYIAWLQAQDAAAARRFWREELHVLPSARRPEGTRRERRGSERRTERIPLPPEIEAAVSARAAEWRTTPASLLATAIAVGLGRLRGSSDVVFGVTASGRPPRLPGVERMVGSFVSNVPLRVRFDPEQPIGELVRAVQRAQARRQPFEHASLAQIQEWSGRSGSRALFDTLALLNLDTAPAPDWPGGLSFEPVSATLDAGTPVVVALIREESGIVLRTVYDSTNPSGAQMARAVFDAVRDVSLAPAGAPTSEFLSIVPVAGGGAAPPVDQEPSADDRAARIARPEEAGGNSALAVMEIWRQTLGISGAELHQDFFHVGGTSLQAIELFHRLERLFGRPLSVSTLFRAPTLGALLDELEQPLAASGPVVPIRTRGTSPPVFAAPGIHGEVVGLAPVAWALGDDQPFFGLEPKGFDRKTAPLTTIEEMVEYFLPPVIEQAEGRPLHLLGICFGSFVVLELARALQARSIPVRSVSLLEPGVLDASDGSIPGEDAWALYGQPSTLGVARRRLRRFKALFRTADWPGRVAMVAQKGRRALEIVRSGGLGPEFEGELARGQSTVGLVEAGVAAIRAHRPEPIATPCRIFVAAEHLPASGQSDWRLDWVELFEPSPDVVAVPGRGVMDALREEAFARSLGAWLSAMSHP